MKTILAFVVAAVCTALLISSANAGGGRRQGLGMSSSGASSGALSNGRSPLGEPVFLTPSSSPSGGPIGGYVAPWAPLPPLIAPNPNVASFGGPSSTPTGAASSARAAQLIPSSISTASAASSSEGGHIRVTPTEKSGLISSGADTKIIFTPPPTIVGVTPQVTATGNIAGNNSVADKPFGGSILDTGLGAHSLQTGSDGATPRVTITPFINSGPTVQVPTASSTSSTTTSAATTSGH